MRIDNYNYRLGSTAKPIKHIDIDFTDYENIIEDYYLENYIANTVYIRLYIFSEDYELTESYAQSVNEFGILPELSFNNKKLKVQLRNTEANLIYGLEKFIKEKYLAGELITLRDYCSPDLEDLVITATDTTDYDVQDNDAESILLENPTNYTLRVGKFTLPIKKGGLFDFNFLSPPILEFEEVPNRYRSIVIGGLTFYGSSGDYVRYISGNHAGSQKTISGDYFAPQLFRTGFNLKVSFAFQGTFSSLYDVAKEALQWGDPIVVVDNFDPISPGAAKTGKILSLTAEGGIEYSEILRVYYMPMGFTINFLDDEYSYL
jgi:hypothetical protein